MLKVLGVVGARPNFMKIAPVFRILDLKREHFITKLVHTGQHYDKNMSRVFFNDLGLRKPHIELNIGSGTHAEQTAKIMLQIEPILLEEKPDLLLVVGDVNSTLAAAIVASKINIPIAHIEAGLRSYDRSMPEEINRIVTDTLSDYLFTTSKNAIKNLVHEGISIDKIHFVGNVMIDTLMQCKALSEKSEIFNNLGIKKKEYILLTIHRPSNVDNESVLNDIMEALFKIQKSIRIIFPAHPRTWNSIKHYGYESKLAKMENISIIAPLGYIDFLALESDAKAVLTDSGGIQEETTVLGTPCITLRENTERPITVTKGTNQIVGHDRQKILEATYLLLEGKAEKGCIPELWDGHAAERLVDVLHRI